MNRADNYESSSFLDKDKRDKVLTYLKKMGASLSGVGDVSVGLAKEFRHMPRAISIGIHHPLSKHDCACGQLYSPFYAAIDRQLLKIQNLLVRWLRSGGWKALAIPPDSNRYDNSYISRLYPLFPHKTAATCAGLGWVGKSGLLISKKYGPYVSWASVLTDAPLETCSEPILSSQCGDCRRCVEACPAGAIKDMYWVRGDSYQTMIDPKKCAEQLKMNFKKFGSPTCGLCILACPRGEARDSLV